MKLFQHNGMLFIISLLISISTYATVLKWDPQVKRGKLDNGLQYYFYNSANKTDPFNLRLIVNAGSVDEIEVKGIAHAVEHMVFNQTKAHPETIHQYLQKIGWQEGKQINAKTQPTQTQYMLRTRPFDALNLQESLHLLSDIVGNAKFDEQQWKIEQKVITEERRIGESVVKRLDVQKKRSTKADSKYSEGSVSGTFSTIDSITFGELQAFYKRNYVASNMTLIASGYFDNAHLEKLISESFAQLPTRSKPQRDYINFPLDSRIKLNKVQDKAGSSYRVVLGLRVAILTKDTLEGVRIRLNNYLVRRLISAQVGRDDVYLPESVERLSSSLREPANERLTLAFSAKTKDHDKGLKSILTEIERLRRYGISRQALQKLINTAKETALRTAHAAKNRDFEKWEDKITEAIVAGGVLSSPEDKLATINKILDTTTLKVINKHLQTMLNAKDVFIYYQAPGAIQLTLPNEKKVKNWIAELQTASLKKPVKEPEADIKKENTTAIKSTVSPITSEMLASPITDIKLLKPTQQYVQQNILEWQLANHNRVVWLNQATPDNRLYLKSISDIGFNNQQQSSWMANSAIQIFEQSPPTGIEQSQWSEWQEDNGIQWEFKLQEHHLDMSIVTEKEKLDSAMHAFWLNHQTRKFSNEAIEEVKTAIKEQQENRKNNRTLEYLYGTKNDDQQVLKKLTELDSKALSHTAYRLLNQPKTLFLVGQIEQHQLQALIAKYVAPLRNAPALKTKLQLLRSGKYIFQQKIKGDVKGKVQIYGRSSLSWTPETAFMLSTLNPVIQKALRQRLRLELGGVYRVAFEMKLNSDTNQVESELSFVSAPERVEELSLAAKKVLQNISPAIEKMSIERVKKDISFAEDNRLNQPTTWLRRLMLSYRAYNDPRYLHSMSNIENKLTISALTQLANKVLPLKNLVQINTQYQIELDND